MRRTTPEGTGGSPGSKEFTIVRAPQAGHALVRQNGFTEPPAWPPDLGLPTPRLPDQSKWFSSVLAFRRNARGSQFQTVCFSITPVHLPHRCGQHLKMFCLERAGARVTSCCLLISSVRCDCRVNSQLEFKAHAAVSKNSRGIFL